MRSILVLWLALALTGCVLAPQTISLNEQVELQGEITEQRNALVRVLDNRPDTSGDQLGHRGGRAPDLSPVLSDKPLSVVLTNRMRDSLRSLGFGSESDLEPIRVQLEVKTFAYRCNESIIVNECGIEMRFLVSVINEDRTFNKPYGIKEIRSLAASPVAEYNEKWVNEVLDKVWRYMFEDADLKSELGVN